MIWAWLLSPSCLFGPAVLVSSSSTVSSTGPWSPSLDPRTWTTRMWSPANTTNFSLIALSLFYPPVAFSVMAWFLTLTNHFFNLLTCISFVIIFSLVWRSSSAGWASTIRSQASSFTGRWRLWAADSVWGTPWKTKLKCWPRKTETRSACPLLT